MNIVIIPWRLTHLIIGPTSEILFWLLDAQRIQGVVLDIIAFIEAILIWVILNTKLYLYKY